MDINTVKNKLMLIGYEIVGENEWAIIAKNSIETVILDISKGIKFIEPSDTEVSFGDHFVTLHNKLYKNKIDIIIKGKGKVKLGNLRIEWAKYKSTTDKIIMISTPSNKYLINYVGKKLKLSDTRVNGIYGGYIGDVIITRSNTRISGKDVYEVYVGNPSTYSIYGTFTGEPIMALTEDFEIVRNHKFELYAN